MATNLATDAGTRQDTFIVRVYLNGEYMGIFDKKSGGGLTSDVLVYQPGGMRPRVSLGGKKSTDDLTLSRDYDRVRDHDQINKWLQAVGSGKVTVTQRPMDLNENEYGKAVTWNGTLKSAGPPDTDSTSTDASSFEITVGVITDPTAI